MRYESFRARWHRIAPAARRRFPELTELDLLVIGGELELFYGIVSRRTGRDRRELEVWIDGVLGSCAEEPRPPSAEDGHLGA
jgi:hypothetical protein